MSDFLISMANRVVDGVLGVNPRQVLNAGGQVESVENPARALMQTSKRILAIAIDPETGLVDYQSLKSSEEYDNYRQIARAIQSCQPEDIGHGADRAAFWINLYNALIIDTIIQFDLRGSIMKRPGIFRQAAYDVGGFRFSADDIEHGILRQNRRNPSLPVPPFASDDPRRLLMVETFDPRIHFSLVCGAISCPPISFYDPDHLDHQLDLAASSFINSSGVRADLDGSTLWLSRIFKWYQHDFGGLRGVLQEIRSHVKEQELIRLMDRGSYKIRYTKYDWHINRIQVPNQAGVGSPLD